MLMEADLYPRQQSTLYGYLGNNIVLSGAEISGAKVMLVVCNTRKVCCSVNI